MYSTKENIAILCDLLLQHGIHHVVCCPGSRNAALVHNFDVHPEFICHAATDERSAGFLALGLTLQTGRPAAVCVTSGSALLNVLPAAAEATYQHQGILVISADRPEAWIDQLDGQTLPQPGALGRFAPKCVNLPEPATDEQRWLCNRLTNEALLALTGKSRPSVHINVQLSEPLFDFSLPELPHQRAVRRCTIGQALAMYTQAKRPMMVCGQATGLENELYDQIGHTTLLTEPLSSDCGNITDAILAALPDDITPFLPDCLIYMGGHTVSKRLRQFLRRLPEQTTVIMVNPEGKLQDVTQHATHLLEVEPKALFRAIEHETLPYTDFQLTWAMFIEEAVERFNSVIPDYSQALAVKLFEEQCYKEGDTVFYANSTAVRLAAFYASHHCHCNRGLNGIEGSLSTAAGAAMADADQRIYCVIGDLSFFYDQNALWPEELGGNLRILLLNNGGGGIFRQLPGLEQSAALGSYIAASHHATAQGICQQFGVSYLTATDATTLTEGLKQLQSMASDRPVLLEVFTDAQADSITYAKLMKAAQK